MSSKTLKNIIQIFSIHLTIIFIFSIVYFLLDKYNPNSFGSNKSISYIDALYISANTHTTVGFGDVQPKLRVSRLICTIHVLFSFFLGLVDLPSIVMSIYKSRLCRTKNCK